MIVKVHKSGLNTILAVCDSDLFGKKFEEKDLQLDLTSSFFNGKEVSDEQIVILTKNATIMSFVGKSSVSLAIKAGVVDKANVGKIKGIPHAQVVRM